MSLLKVLSILVLGSLWVKQHVHGQTLNPGDVRTVYFCKLDMNMYRNDAKSFCLAKGGRLARAYTLKEHMSISTAAGTPKSYGRYHFDYQWYTGGVWAYSDFTTPNYYTLDTWYKSRPITAKSIAYYWDTMATNTFLWWDSPDSMYWVLCEFTSPCISGGYSTPEQSRTVYFCKYEGVYLRNAASNLCTSKNGQLARVYNSAEHLQILNLGLITGVTYHFDLKWSYQGNYFFSDGSVPTFWPWAIGRPILTYASTYAIYWDSLSPQMFQWYDYTDAGRSCICEFASPCATGTVMDRTVYYCKYDSTTYTHNQATAMCTSKNGQLAKVYNIQEHRQIVELGLINSGFGYHFDLQWNTGNSYTFSDGTVPIYWPWVLGRPATFVANFYGIYWSNSGTTTWQWLDAVDTARYAICEFSFPCGPAPIAARQVYYCKYEDLAYKVGASSNCIVKGGRLARVYTLAEHQQVLNIPLAISGYGYHTDLKWNSVGNYTFPDGTSPTDWPWALGRPYSSWLNTHVYYYSNAGADVMAWQDWGDLYRPYICEFTKPCAGSIVSNDRVVYFCKYEARVNRADAFELCTGKGGQLARVYTLTEHQMILNLGLVTSAVGYHFDLKWNANNNYTCNDGTAPSYWPWQLARPIQGSTNVFGIYWNANNRALAFEWYDYVDYPRSVLCEFTSPCAGNTITSRTIYFCKYETSIYRAAAITLCTGKNGKLAKVYTLAEHQQVISLGLIPTIVGYHFDLQWNAGQNYTFSDGTVPSYWPWSPGRPLYGGSSAIFGIYWGNTGTAAFGWQDFIDWQRSVICEFTTPCLPNTITNRIVYYCKYETSFYRADATGLCISKLGKLAKVYTQIEHLQVLSLGLETSAFGYHFDLQWNSLGNYTFSDGTSPSYWPWEMGKPTLTYANTYAIYWNVNGAYSFSWHDYIDYPRSVICEFNTPCGGIYPGT